MISDIVSRTYLDFDANFKKASIIALGPIYYYVVDSESGFIEYCSDAFMSIHGLSKRPVLVSEVDELISPEDVTYIDMVNHCISRQLDSMGVKSLANTKMSYFIEMKHSNGIYQNFLRQQIILNSDEAKKPKFVMYVHTYMQHIFPRASKKISLRFLGSENRPIDVQLSPNYLCDASSQLTKRESEILSLLIKGCGNREIAKQLYISIETVKTHRNQVLKKTNSANTHELMKKCRMLGVF